MPADSAIASDSLIAELLRRFEVENKMADQLRSQSRQSGGAIPKLQSEIATHSARANQLRSEWMGAIAARGRR